MSAQCERAFSVAGKMVTPLRNRLDAETIELCQVLRSWYRAGILDGQDGDGEVWAVPLSSGSDGEGEQLNDNSDSEVDSEASEIGGMEDLTAISDSE